jgi:radical SAM superfamily enzyme with C-terminal helix-hairpin-helix motif
MMQNNQIKKTEIRQNQLTQDELKEIYDIGFRQFKLIGRDATSAAMVYDISRYILENDQIFPMLFKTFLESPIMTGDFN